ncbi:uncharacterized protein BO97DRAFT_229646 [Aspergillus homomorphus CBS 101889]|uniref:Uncharacterized protein n=1 Tax=Aspergillus homomorphus (strain CBS 101889) TaxID=1450537 RepID=A0A395HM92_ASPHC|nr:hypothetical protein BO97DRAFT_229646 [Aspergillus homomorphus CBS 101889]RAL07978.1 hypothetical protein BO97DRAFT_229646 [Aspergillus homomorphus CBS 101889]
MNAPSRRRAGSNPIFLVGIKLARVWEVWWLNLFGAGLVGGKPSLLSIFSLRVAGYFSCFSGRRGQFELLTVLRVLVSVSGTAISGLRVLFHRFYQGCYSDFFSCLDGSLRAAWSPLVPASSRRHPRPTSTDNYILQLSENHDLPYLLL